MLSNKILKEEFSIKKEMGYLLLQNPDLKESSPNLCVNCFRHNMQEAA